MFNVPLGFTKNPQTIRTTAHPLTEERVFCCPSDPKRGGAFVARCLLAILAVGLLAGPVAAQSATPVPKEAIETATTWLISQQGENGGFTGFSGEIETGVTVDALLALAAVNAAGTNVDLNSAVEYLYSGDVALVYAQTGAGQAAKLVLAVVAIGGDPHDVAGVDPLSLATADIDGATGHYGTGVFDHALVMMAIAAAGETVPEDAISRLVNSQLKDGSWSFDGDETPGAGDTNTTAVAIMALVASGKGSGRDVKQGLEYLKSTMNDDGSFPYQPADGAPGDANSTGLVVQALIAAGQDPSSSEWNNAMSRLLMFQNGDGAFHYMEDLPDDNLFATVQALPAIAGIAFPLIQITPVASPVAA